ncbi:hypothetical protein L1O48_07565 [Ligilactobacillus equi]|uniref:hypothetical protein n=1 Tax=Ligilactobacillus equi TaxID=137357 RepID=UPI002ED0B272
MKKYTSYSDVSVLVWQKQRLSDLKASRKEKIAQPNQRKLLILMAILKFQHQAIVPALQLPQADGTNTSIQLRQYEDGQYFVCIGGPSSANFYSCDNYLLEFLDDKVCVREVSKTALLDEIISGKIKEEVPVFEVEYSCQDLASNYDDQKRELATWLRILEDNTRKIDQIWLKHRECGE